jgi:3-oxoacyl-[acyl-carrier protein] reductase
MTELDGRVAVVTGGSRGIGAAIARAFTAAGATVIVHSRVDSAAARTLTAELRSGPGHAVNVFADLAETDGPTHLWAEFDRVTADLGLPPELNVLVNNAGINVRGTIDTLTPADFDRLIAVNQSAPFFVTQHALPRIRDGGRVINISSGSARYARPDIIGYAMTKGAIDVFTRTLAAHVGHRGITVNAIAPGLVDTDMNAHLLRGPQAAVDFAASTTALKSLANTADIADIACFIASARSQSITGQTIDATHGNRL